MLEMINALSYIGVRSDRTEDWRAFAGQLLGMQVLDRGGRNTAFRMDDQAQRLIVSDEPGDTLAYLGWEVAQKDALDKYASMVQRAGQDVQWGSPTLCDRRYVKNLISFLDPAGNRIELVWKPERASEPFVPGRPIDGFKTGPYGMGHAVLNVKDAAALVPFYRDVLGFSLSDFGRKPVPMYFFHVNGRHHSFAIIETGQEGFHHLMVEYDNLDDMGQGYDLANNGMAEVAYTLGRHTNDFMTSFYAHTPSDFFVESGWGGRIIDPAEWAPHETNIGPSFWGHERLHLPESVRSTFREKRLDTAAKGNRAPPLPDCPWLWRH